MEMTTTTYECDIEGCKNEPEKENRKKSIPMIFLTEQTEGRGVKPYLTSNFIDICQHCLDIILKGNFVYGSGAQGHNTYTLEGVPTGKIHDQIVGVLVLKP